MLKNICTILAIIGLVVLSNVPATTNSYLYYPRVRDAKENADPKLRATFESKGLNYPPRRMFMRVFKSENTLELWAINDKTGKYVWVKNYDVCAMSGILGPKRRQGDKQVPEGFYHISAFNPDSKYHLSMKVNYPNKADRALSPFDSLGGDIFIHGQCKSIGCISVKTDYIKEVFWLTTQVKNRGQRKIPVHILPTRLSNLKHNILKQVYRNDPDMLDFWANLKQGYDYFERQKIPPNVRISSKGKYSFN